MKLLFKQNYISIRHFEPVELKDFSLLTGLNGSGKTHFLKAIENGAIEIEGIETSQVIYYNYNDFTIFIGDPSNHQTYKTRIDIANKATNEFLQNLTQKRNSLITDRLNSQKLDLLDHKILSFSQQANFQYELVWGDKKNYQEIEKIVNDKGEINRDNFNFLRGRIGDHFFNFINSFFTAPSSNTLPDINFELIKTRYDKIIEDLESDFKEKHTEFYDFIKSNVSLKSIYTISHIDFESPNFTLKEIADAERDYQFLITNNSLNKIKTNEWGQNVPFLEKEKFIEVYGLSPIEQINEVLNEYDCNGYYLTNNNFTMILGQALTSTNINVALKHKENNYITDFNSLSSGEKTLIALSLLIYKSRKNKIIPRVILLDEVDSSLHPTMINRLLSVIENVFLKKNIKVIFATHSPTTIALAPSNSIYFINKYGENKITPIEQKKAINILTEGFATLQEGLQFLDELSKRKTCIISEGNNISYIKKANEFFGSSDVEILEGIENITGKDQLKTYFEFFSKVPHETKVFFVWDCDVSNTLQSKNNTFPFIFSKNVTNTKNLKGIENLFEEKHFVDEFYVTKNKEDGGIHTSLNKKKFEDHILSNGTTDDFKNFKALFDFIKNSTT